MTAPGASRIRPASSPVLPVRGPPIRSVTSSIGDQIAEPADAGDRRGQLPGRHSEAAPPTDVPKAWPQDARLPADWDRTRLAAESIARRLVVLRDRRAQRLRPGGSAPAPTPAGEHQGEDQAPTMSGHGQTSRPGVSGDAWSRRIPKPNQTAPNAATRARSRWPNHGAHRAPPLLGSSVALGCEVR